MLAYYIYDPEGLVTLEPKLELAGARAGADVVEVVEVPRLAPRRRASRERSPPR